MVYLNIIRKALKLNSLSVSNISNLNKNYTFPENKDFEIIGSLSTDKG